MFITTRISLRGVPGGNVAGKVVRHGNVARSIAGRTADPSDYSSELEFHLHTKQTARTNTCLLFIGPVALLLSHSAQNLHISLRNGLSLRFGF